MDNVDVKQINRTDESTTLRVPRWRTFVVFQHPTFVFGARAREGWGQGWEGGGGDGGEQ